MISALTSALHVHKGVTFRLGITVSIGVASFPKLSVPEMPSLMSTAVAPDDCVSKLNVSC